VTAAEGPALEKPIPGRQPIQVVLADQYAVVRRAFQVAISADAASTVVAEAADSATAIAACRRYQPDVVVISSALPGDGGLDTVRSILALGLPTQALLTALVSLEEETDYLLQALRAGASGYILAETADSDLTTAIHTIHRGEVFLYPSAVELFLAHYRFTYDQSSRKGLAQSELSDDELTVLRYSAAGSSPVEIARRLQRGPSRVRQQQREILAKLGLTERAAIVRYASQHGLL
jgi:two-component system response regulator NreC